MSSGADRVQQIAVVFIAICVAFGLLVGCVGLGVGLIFLTVPQAIGTGLLAVGAGALFGMLFGGKRIMRPLIKELKEMETQKPASK